MIASSTSSPVDQLALVGDRTECLQELSRPVIASNGVEVSAFSVGISLHNSLKEGHRLVVPTSVVGVAVKMQ